METKIETNFYKLDEVFKKKGFATGIIFLLIAIGVSWAIAYLVWNHMLCYALPLPTMTWMQTLVGVIGYKVIKHL